MEYKWKFRNKPEQTKPKTPSGSAIIDVYILPAGGKYTLSKFEHMMGTWLPCHYKGETKFFDTAEEAYEFSKGKKSLGIDIQDA